MRNSLTRRVMNHHKSLRRCHYEDENSLHPHFHRVSGCGTLRRHLLFLPIHQVLCRRL